MEDKKALEERKKERKKELDDEKLEIMDSESRKTYEGKLQKKYKKKHIA